MRRAGTAHWNLLRELTANAVRLGLRMVRGLANTDGAAIVAEGLRPIPSSQPENKNSPRQLESEAGLSHGIPRPISGILGAAALPQSENHIGQQQCVAFVLRHTIFRKRGFSQINVTTRRRSTSSTGVSREPQTLSRELRAMGYRKLSVRPRHHAQAEGAIEDFRKRMARPVCKRFYDLVLSVCDNVSGLNRRDDFRDAVDDVLGNLDTVERRPGWG